MDACRIFSLSVKIVRITGFFDRLFLSVVFFILSGPFQPKNSYSSQLLLGEVFLNYFFDWFLLLHFVLFVLGCFSQMTDDSWQAAHMQEQSKNDHTSYVPVVSPAAWSSPCGCLSVFSRAGQIPDRRLFSSLPKAHAVGAGAGNLDSRGTLQRKSGFFPAFSTPPYDSAFLMCFKVLKFLFSSSLLSLSLYVYIYNLFFNCHLSGLLVDRR